MPDLPRLFARPPIARPDAERLAATVKAASEPTRLEILSILAARPGLIAEDFVSILGLSQPTMAHHMRILRDAGLVTAVRDGRCTRYAVDEDGFRALADAIRPGGER